MKMISTAHQRLVRLRIAGRPGASNSGSLEHENREARHNADFANTL